MNLTTVRSAKQNTVKPRVTQFSVPLKNRVPILKTVHHKVGKNPKNPRKIHKFLRYEKFRVNLRTSNVYGPNSKDHAPRGCLFQGLAVHY